MARTKGTTPPADNHDREHDDTNVVVIVGQAHRDASGSASGDGGMLSTFDVICRTPQGRTVVPVTVEGECSVRAGQRVAVLGRVHKRFFASGAGLSSRTDVRADRVTVIRRKDQVARVIAGAAGILGL